MPWLVKEMVMDTTDAKATLRQNVRDVLGEFQAVV